MERSESASTIEGLQKFPIWFCNEMSLRALHVPPSPSFDISFALFRPDIGTPLRDEWYKSFATFLVATK